MESDMSMSPCRAGRTLLGARGLDARHRAPGTRRPRHPAPSRGGVAEAGVARWWFRTLVGTIRIARTRG